MATLEIQQHGMPSSTSNCFDHQFTYSKQSLEATVVYYYAASLQIPHTCIDWEDVHFKSECSSQYDCDNPTCQVIMDNSNGSEYFMDTADLVDWFDACDDMKQCIASFNTLCGQFHIMVSFIRNVFLRDAQIFILTECKSFILVFGDPNEARQEYDRLLALVVKINKIDH